MWPKKLLFLLTLVPSLVSSLAPTDEIQDADPAQSGYLSNHNMHPATVGSSIFGILWKNQYGTKEFFYAKPLVYTPPGKTQLVFLSSAMNIIRTIDAVTGAAINTRTVQPPFLQSDIGCTDIPNYIGIIGTPILDPNTDIVYFFSKGYEGNAASGGVAKGRYSLYAVDINTLNDKPGFPVLIDGHYADNDHAKYFIGGTVLQRPSLTMLNGAVIGAFGGHCDLFNYTGMVVAVSTTPGVGVTSILAMEGGPAAQPATTDIFDQGGGKAGIWQGGMGLATDNQRIFIATGNGQGHANGDIPASGRVPLTTLDEVVANIAVSSSGKLTLTDYFEPYEYVSMDAADRDLGSGGVALLDPAVFKGTGVSRIAVTIGKNGKAYIMNADNLGGFKQGPGGTDNILQTIIASGAVFGGAGSFPLDGGYIYFTPTGNPMVCYKFGLDANGKPTFTFVGQTKYIAAGRVGIGIPTTTSYKGQPGTGILWISDPNAGLLAFNAVPDSNGVLTSIPIAPTGGLNKFQRPAFGDGRLYVSDNNGRVYCLGSPVALPLNCTQPVDFGDVAIGNTATVVVRCTALIPLNSVNGCSTGDGTFQCSNSSLPKGPLAQGAQFSFPVTWNLTQAAINDVQNSSFGKVLPGVASTRLEIYTTNGLPKYSTILPITLQGNTVSKVPFLYITPPEVDFGGLVVGGSGQASGLSAAIIVSNIGAQTLTFTGLAWTLAAEDSVYNNITNNPDGSKKLGTVFSSTTFPHAGQTIPAGGTVTVPLTFKANSVGSYSSILKFWSDGGDVTVLLTGSASTAPVVEISVQTNSEGFYSSVEPLVMDFGDVPVLTSRARNIKICNKGGSALTITKSKPPIDQELFAARPLTDLHEGQTIDINSCALGEIDIVAAAAVVNQPPEVLQDVWILNADGNNAAGNPFGVHEVTIKANVVRRQIGPLLGDGSAKFKYLGCYQDVNRLLPKGANGAQQSNENAYCQKTCQGLGYIFAGTEYHVECWCGNTPPPASLFHNEIEKKCTFSCPGDTIQACGGNGGYISVFYDSTRYTPGQPISSVSSSATVATTSKSSSTGTASSSSVTVTSISSQSTTAVSTTIATTPTGGPTIVPSAGAFRYADCYTESTTGRALSSKRLANDSMTVEICASFCSAYTYFGVEYSRECYCGDVLQAGALPAATGCTMLCIGDNSEYCGGSKRLNVYQAAAISASSSSSVSQTSSSRLTSSASVVSSSVSTTSTTKSASSSSSSSASSTSTTAAPATTLVTTTTATTKSSANPATFTNDPLAPTMGFYQQGCFSDPAGGAFAGHFIPLLVRNDSVNIELCLSVASLRLKATPATTIRYVGLEYGRECYGATAAPDPAPASVTAAAACAMTCKGNPLEKCGGPNQMYIYSSPATTSTAAPT